MALEGTVNTPFGSMKKSTAVLAGGGLALIVGIVWYRSKQQSAQQASIAAAGASTIDPATGFPYGSPEDAAALQAQANYTFPGGSGGVSNAGGGTTTPQAGGFTNNAQWMQAAVLQITTTDPEASPAAIEAALGKYLAGAPVTPDQTSIIQTAIGFEGSPPVSGLNGYPPSINTSNPSAGGTSGSGTDGLPTGPFYAPPLNGPPNLHATNVSANSVTLAWNDVVWALSYDVWVSVDGGPYVYAGHSTSTTFTYTANNGHNLGFVVRGKNTAGWGPTSEIHVSLP